MFGITLQKDKEFIKLCREMQKVSGREMKIVIRNATKDYLMGAFKATPIAPKTRKVKAVIWKNAIVINKAGKQVFRKGKYTVMGRGYAKGCWIKAMTGMGINSNPWGKNTMGTATAQSRGWLKDNRQDTKPSITVCNSCEYINKIDSTYKIEMAGLERAKEKIRGGLLKYAEKLEKGFNR